MRDILWAIALDLEPLTQVSLDIDFGGDDEIAAVGTNEESEADLFMNSAVSGRLPLEQFESEDGPR